jgi:hypothetical protein
MNQKGAVIIQVGGSGKGCGKTTLICGLLKFFPDTIAIKSGRHFSGVEELQRDTQKFKDAGALDSQFFSSDDNESLKLYLELIRSNATVIFLEKNERIEGSKPDLYIFIKMQVSNIRSDASMLELNADIVLTKAAPDELLISKVRALLLEKTAN